MHVFGTVMSHSDEGALVDLWCPEEPCFTQKVSVSCQDTRKAIEALIEERILGSFFSEGEFTIRFLSY